ATSATDGFLWSLCAPADRESELGRQWRLKKWRQDPPSHVEWFSCRSDLCCGALWTTSVNRRKLYGMGCIPLQRCCGASGMVTNQDTQQQQRALLDNIPDMAWLKDRDCRYLAVNTAYLGILGIPESAVLGKRPDEIWPAEIAEVYLRTDRAVL